MMAPMAAGPAPSRNARARVVAEAVEPGRAEEHEDERGRERDEGGEETACEPGGCVADDRNGLHHGSGRDLPEGDGVEELGVGHPVVVVTASACMSGMITNPPP